MPKGYVGEISNDDARTFADALEAQTEKAEAAVGGFAERTACIAGVPVSMRFSDVTVADLSTAAFAAGSEPTHDPVTIRVWDSEQTGVPPPPPSWAWHANRYESDDIIVTYDRTRRRIVLVDLARRSAHCWIASFSDWPVWERAAPFREVLDRLLATTGHVFLHAGTLGNDTDVALLAGPSGSGKSTTTAAGIAAGLTSLGDDYVVLDPDGMQAHALYGIFRLEPSSPAAGAHDGQELDHQGKLMISFAHERSESGSSLRPELRVACVVAPTVGRGERTVVQPVSPVVALRALAPTSLVQLDPRADSLRRMRELVERVPTWAFELGSDLEGVVSSVRDVLDDRR